MLSYEILGLATWLMVFSLGYCIGELLVKKLGKQNDVKFLKYARIILSVLSFFLFVWLLFYKELFHWHFDISTGEPVDHYSTYGRCMVYALVAFLSNVVSCVVAKSRKE